MSLRSYPANLGLGFSTKLSLVTGRSHMRPPTLADGLRPPAARRVLEVLGHGTELGAHEPEVEHRQQKHNKYNHTNDSHGSWSPASHG